MKAKSKISRIVTHPGALILGAMLTSQAHAIDLREAVRASLATNPQINQAVANKEAIDFERKQAKGLYGPRISLEASAGARRLENATRRSIGIADETLYPLEADFIAQQTLIDFGRTRSEVQRQAARTDGAALRIQERSEFVGLNASRHYIDYILQQRIVAAAQDNLLFHERLVGDLREGVAKGSISIADQQQAEERLQSARAKLTEAREDLENAGIAFHQLTGVPIGQATMPPELMSSMPPSVDEAVDTARARNPLVREALADIDAASAMVTAARGDLAPKISLEGRARFGDDIDGFKGTTHDYLGRVVLRWDLFDSYVNHNKLKEMIHRESEQRYRLHEVSRQAEADVRTAWTRLQSQGELVKELEQQSRVSDDLLLSYREQFNVGRRSLLDVLDAQNTRYNVQVQTETARLAQLYAQYRVLAASGQLLAALDIAPPASSVTSSRELHNVKSRPVEDLMEPRNPYTSAN